MTLKLTGEQKLTVLIALNELFKSDRWTAGRSEDSIDKIADRAQHLMKQIEDIIISFRTGIDKTVDYIKEYGLKLKMNAQLAAEEMIMEINEKNELIMNKIDNYIDKAIESFVPINDICVPLPIQPPQYAELAAWYT